MRHKFKYNRNLDPSDALEAMCLERGCATLQDVSDMDDEAYRQLHVAAMNVGMCHCADPVSIWAAFDNDVKPLFDADGNLRSD